MIANLYKKSNKLADLAMLDPLTKQYNRHRLEIDMEEYLEQGHRHEVTASLLLMDLDYFKEINDYYGHDIGDKILLTASQIILSTLRNEDRLYRWGGDEFLILTLYTDVAGAARLAQRINEKFSQVEFPSAKNVTVSIGCAQHFPYETKDSWFKRVDLALYRAKQLGRNRSEIWENSETLPPTMTKKVWGIQFESGNEVIDSQHKSILDLSNELYDSLGSADSAENLEKIMDKVMEEMQAHFIYEVNLMRTTSFPFTDEHEQIHKQLLIDYNSLRLQLKTGIINLGGFFNFVSERLINDHILHEDTKFFAHLKTLKR